MSETIGGAWQPIETAPKDGRRVLCWAVGWRPCFLEWKTNRRIADYRAEWPSDVASSYFGDPNEDDDYHLARAENAPTHWLPIPVTPDNRCRW